jgi:hypothetical protein
VAAACDSVGDKAAADVGGYLDSSAERLRTWHFVSQKEWLGEAAIEVKAAAGAIRWCC